MLVTTLVVTPAYGRDYRTEEEALEAWKSGKDFRNETIGVSGTYVGAGETDLMISMGVQRVQIRFNNKEDVTIVNLIPVEDQHEPSLGCCKEHFNRSGPGADLLD